MARIRTNDGRLVDPMNIKPEDVIPRVMIHSLCQINRFTGHADWPYSVGQHTLNLYYYLKHYMKLHSRDIRRAALIHDMQEAWFNDLASPLKCEMLEYKAAEHKAALVVRATLGVSSEALEFIDMFDKRMYKNERIALFKNIDELGMGDDYVELPDPQGVLHFYEEPWRMTKSVLLHVFNEEFGYV
jgi:uncharacterized protein